MHSACIKGLSSGPRIQAWRERHGEAARCEAIAQQLGRTGAGCNAKTLVRRLVRVKRTQDVGIRRMGRCPLLCPVVGENGVEHRLNPVTKLSDPLGRHEIKQCRCRHQIRGRGQQRVEFPGQVALQEIDDNTPAAFIDRQLLAILDNPACPSCNRLARRAQQRRVMIDKRPVLLTGQHRRQRAQIRTGTATEVDNT